MQAISSLSRVEEGELVSLTSEDTIELRMLVLEDPSEGGAGSS